MSSFSSVFEAPPGQLFAPYEDPSVEFAHIVQTSILLGQDGSPAAPEVNYHIIEPLPHVDYHLIYVLLNLCYGGKMNKREVKRYDYLIDARKHYYRSHYLFMLAFSNLQDAHAYGLQLDHEKTKLEESGSGTAEDLETIATAMQSNYMDLNYCLGELVERRRRRLHVTTWFSSMKYDFIRSEMSRLTFVGKQAYLRNKQLQDLAHQIPPVISQQASGYQSTERRFSGPQPSMTQSSGLLTSDLRSSGPQFPRPQPSGVLSSGPLLSGHRISRPQSSGLISSGPRYSGHRISRPQSSRSRSNRPQIPRPQTLDIPLPCQSLSAMLNDEVSVEALMREAGLVSNQSRQRQGHVMEEEEEPNAMGLS